MTDAGSTGGLVYRIPCGMSSTGAARTKSRDRGAWVSYPATLTASHVQGRHHRRVVKETVMPPTITSEVIVAYAQCPRKAYLLLFNPDRGEPHEYVRIREQQQQNLRSPRRNKRRSKQVARSFLSRGSTSFRLTFSRCCLYT